MLEKDCYFDFQQFRIHQNHAAMKVGTDSDLLGALCATGRRILDVGTGTGVLALMMAQRCADAQITAVEIDDGAVIDAKRNFEESRFGSRITLVHSSFQDFVAAQQPGAAPFDCVVCNPPYFDRSLECPDQSRTRARHTSSLPFAVLIEGAFGLLEPEGVFSVCIPPEVLEDFVSLCRRAGFWLQAQYCIKTIPEKGPKRFVVVCRKGEVAAPRQEVYCMRNSDRTRSPWYRELMKDFLLCGEK